MLHGWSDVEPVTTLVGVDEESSNLPELPPTYVFLEDWPILASGTMEAERAYHAVPLASRGNRYPFHLRPNLAASFSIRVW